MVIMFHNKCMDTIIRTDENSILTQIDGIVRSGSNLTVITPIDSLILTEDDDKRNVKIYIDILGNIRKGELN